MKIRILEIGAGSYFKQIRPSQVDYYQIGKKAPDATNMTFRLFCGLKRKLACGEYDVVVASFYGICSTPWRRERNAISNLIQILRCCCGRFHAFGPWIILGLVQGTSVPLIVVDRKDDPALIPPQFFGLLKKCRTYYWREMPVKIENGFMFTTGRMEDTSAVRKTEVFRKNHAKIKPISLGLKYDEAARSIDPSSPKDIDILFIGTCKGEMSRETGVKLLEELRREGFAVEIILGRGIPRKEFLEKCARSWLVWSPEGHGWDCHRHYEACMVGAVPLINYPRILRYRPLIDRVHAFYYGVEGDDLKRVAKQALADKTALHAMSVAARRHVLEYHTDDKLFEYVFGA
ncbi:MAG: hypothetical protein PHD76_09830 [Methylacidiphilales bacterium]|nr:hypothetical protein [Candidatus Methylacidiphilales bacterium]